MLGIELKVEKVVNSSGELYQSKIKIKANGEEIRPEYLFSDLEGLKLNEVLRIGYAFDDDEDPYLQVVGDCYEAKNKRYFNNRNGSYKKNLSSSPTEEEIKELKLLFKLLLEDFKTATKDLKATIETINY